MDCQLALDLRCPILIIIGLGIEGFGGFLGRGGAGIVVAGLGDVADAAMLGRRGSGFVDSGRGIAGGGGALGSESLVSFFDEGLNLGS